LAPFELFQTHTKRAYIVQNRAFLSTKRTIQKLGARLPAIVSGKSFFGEKHEEEKFNLLGTDRSQCVSTYKLKLGYGSRKF
jgi:hypothetical protein